MAAKPRHSPSTARDTCTGTRTPQSAAQRTRTGTGRLAPATLRAQLDVLAAQERRVRIVEVPAPPPLWISESALQRLITDLAEWCGWVWWHDEDSRKNDAGLPDLLLIRRRLIWREIKTERSKLRPEQLAFGQRLLRAGQDWCVWKPSDWRAIVVTLTGEEE